jgi:hypothetical protein
LLLSSAIVSKLIGNRRTISLAQPGGMARNSS